MTFHIGNQSANVVNNVAGDQTIHGNQTGRGVDPDTLIGMVAAVRTAVADASLPAPTRAAVTSHLDALEGSVASRTDGGVWRARFDDITALLAGAAGAVGNWGVLQAALGELGKGLGVLS